MIRCPIVDKAIDIGKCVLIVDISEGCVKEYMLPVDIACLKEWKEICNRCEYHNN